MLVVEVSIIRTCVYNRALYGKQELSRHLLVDDILMEEKAVQERRDRRAGPRIEGQQKTGFNMQWNKERGNKQLFTAGR